ncbi:MAG: response regulator [Candidatus Omnitrophica bacterium]|nr:response regulator [Candidatus Omnitrophota bacterium]
MNIRGDNRGMAKSKNMILVIDNDKAFTSLVYKFLKDICKYEVKIVPDGYNGIIFAEKSTPELILLDIRMPAMNGLGILEKLKSNEKTAHIPVIILTGFDDDDIKNRALSLKAADYLSKPIDLEVLRQRIAAALK